MRSLLPALSLALLALFLTGCQAPRQPSSTYGVSQDGTVAVQTRSALDGSLAPGPQEIFGVAIPLPPFMLKGGLLWDGMPVVIGPSRQVAPSAAAPCGVQTTYVTETYTEYEPVQKTRQVPVRSVSLPVPQAAPRCPEPPEPVAVLTAR